MPPWGAILAGMPLQWPVDKLTLINRALAQTGDNGVNVLEDGSDEYSVCSPAYEDALAVMLEEHGWVNATKVSGALVPAGNVPTDAEFDTAYDMPNDLLHLIWVRLGLVPAIYSILDGQIVVLRFGNGAVTIKYVSTDNSDPTAGTPMFVRALTGYVMAAIYRSLHQDAGEAARMFAMADALCQRARTRSDQQKPKTQLWNSRITMARQVRHPWQRIPRGWGGTGNG